jgi:hypothetical protein
MRSKAELDGWTWDSVGANEINEGVRKHALKLKAVKASLPCFELAAVTIFIHDS